MSSMNMVVKLSHNNVMSKIKSSPSISSLHEGIRPSVQLDLGLLPNILDLLLERLLPPVLLISPISRLFLGPTNIKNSQQYVQHGDATPGDVKSCQAHCDGECRLEGYHASDAQRDGAQVGEAADHCRHREAQKNLVKECADRASVEDFEWRRQDGGLGVWGRGLSRDVNFVEDLEACSSEGEEGGDQAEDLF